MQNRIRSTTRGASCSILCCSCLHHSPHRFHFPQDDGRRRPGAPRAHAGDVRAAKLAGLGGGWCGFSCSRLGWACPRRVKLHVLNPSLFWAGPAVATPTLDNHQKPSPAPASTSRSSRRNMAPPTANPCVRLVGWKEAPAPGLRSASRLARPRRAAVALHRSGTSLKSRLPFAISSV